MIRRKVSNGLLRATKSNSSLRATAQAQAHTHAPVPPLPSSVNAAKAAAVKPTASVNNAMKDVERNWGKETVVTLKQELKNRGLPQTGNKATLVERLAANASQPTSKPTSSITSQATSSFNAANPAAAPKTSVSNAKAPLTTPKTIAVPKSLETLLFKPATKTKSTPSLAAAYSTQSSSASSSNPKVPSTPQKAQPTKVESVKASAPPPSAWRARSESPSKPEPLRNFSTTAVKAKPPKRSTPAAPKASEKTVSDDHVTSSGPEVSSQKVQAPRTQTPTAEEVTVAPGLPKTKSTPSDKSTMTMKMPEPTKEAEVEQVIPVTPDNFRQTKDTTPSSSTSPGPKVMTVASASTHPAGGPSHAIHSSSDATSVENAEPRDTPSGSAAAATLPSFPSLGSILPEIGAPKGSSNGGEYKADDRPLNEEERRGLYILGGVIGLGWLLGGPKKDKKSPKQKSPKGKKESGGDGKGSKGEVKGDEKWEKASAAGVVGHGSRKDN